MHVVEGERGIVVIDPLISAETAAAALALYREHRGERPVTGLIYTHSHIDHFGGAAGIVSAEEVAEREIPVLAPEGFLHHAVSENVYAGTAMGRRAGYMYGAKLQRGPDGGIGSGLGQTTSLGTLTLIPPNVEVTETGQEETVDGVRMVFQLDPRDRGAGGDELPLPRAPGPLHRRERDPHDAQRPHPARRARPRPPRLGRATSTRRSSSSATAATSSSPATTGRAGAASGSSSYLAKQRDLYAYLHDQTLRLINAGLTGPEIAEELELPPELADEWHCRGYYGSVSHNVRRSTSATWAGSTATRPTSGSTRRSSRPQRYVEFMGGAEQVLERARKSFAAGDYRWVAEVVNHVVFAEPEQRGGAASCRPKRSSSSATAPRTRPGATSTWSALRSCATG